MPLIFGNAKLTMDELLIPIVEVEVIVNFRPLLYLATDDLEEPLTPFYLPIGQRVLSLSNNIEVFDDED